MQTLPTFQRLTYSGLEPSQAFDIVYGGHFEHRLLSAGRASLEHQRLVLDDVRLETGSYDFPIVVRGVMPPNVVCIGLMAGGIETTRYNTASIGADEIQIYPQNADLLYCAEAASRWVNFTMPEEHLQQVAVALAGEPLDLPRGDAVSIQLTRGGRNRLIRLVDDAFTIGRALGTSGISSALARAIARGLVISYASALHHAARWGKRRGLAARRHLHLVLACEELAMSSQDSEFSLTDIARRSGYSRRALELIFKRSVGSSPGRWFMNARLNGALRDLLMATPECRVTEVAARWGFRHLPRFAEHYRRTFGELPSQTLNRSRA